MDCIGLVDPYASAYDSDNEDIEVELIYKNIKDEKQPQMVFIPSREIMFNIMRACIDI